MGDDLPSIIPGVGLNEQRRCLAEIRQFGQVMTWKPLHNDMTAGEFSYLYVHHARERRNHRPKYMDNHIKYNSGKKSKKKSIE